MGKTIDITNQRFGKLIALYDTGIRKNRQALWHCKCDCGKECDVLGNSLRSGHTTSCGCKRYDKKVEDLTGKKFNNLTVLERKGSDSNRRALWYCKCTCGNFRTVTTTALKTNLIKSCVNCSVKNKKKTIVPIDYINTSWYKEIAGKKFGKLLAIKPTEKRNNAGRVIWECQCDCGNPNPIFVSSSSLKSGNTSSCGCLKNTSIGEEKIKNILISNQIPFKREYTFEDLISPKNSLLRFDFAILDKEKNVKYLIEYDGIQHFHPIERFGGAEGFNYLKKCDELKNQYCKKHNIPLLRINYLNKNITIEDLTYEL